MPNNHCIMPSLTAIRFLLLILTSTLLLAACANQRVLFEILEQTELPVYEGEPIDEPLSLRVLFLVQNDGSVSSVRFISTSSDSHWDSAAADSMMKWRFAPDIVDSSTWISKNIRVQLLPSKKMNLGELITPDEQDAKVLYSRLRAGVSFQQLLYEFRDSSASGITGQYLRDVDTARYPVQVSRILADLKTGQFTRPVQVHGKYIIFQRFGEYIPSD